MLYDVIIVGGSFAGLSAAMQLVRGQRHVLVIDANSPRNRFADASHGVFGLDGKTPAEIRSTALAQLSAYPTFELHEDMVIGAEQTNLGFALITKGGRKAHAKRLILAAGTQDILPNIPGLKERWGKTVIHCPYCHGYELRNRELGVLATMDMSAHQAAMIPDWGETTYFTQREFEPDEETQVLLLNRGVRIEQTPVIKIHGDGEQIKEVVLSDNRVISLGGLYVAPKIAIGTPLVEQLGLDLKETPLGHVVDVDDMKQSSTKGVFVAGDLSNPMQSGTLAIASGTMAGIGAHRSLMFD